MEHSDKILQHLISADQSIKALFALEIVSQDDDYNIFAYLFEIKLVNLPAS